MDKNPQLTDGLIMLRRPRPEDAPALNDAVQESLTELHPWMDWATDAYDEAAAMRWMGFVQLYWEHSTGFQFAITDAVSGQYIGNCSVAGLIPKHRFCNLGYWVRTSRTGQGIASRAARLAVKFAFERAGLVRAEIIIATANIASQRVAEKAGAHYEGILPNGMVVRKDVYDAVMYSLTPADFGLEVKRSAGL